MPDSKHRTQHFKTGNALRSGPTFSCLAIPIISSSKGLQELLDQVQQVAKSDATILITGGSDTGKELVANLIREKSDRREKPFLKINCNTISSHSLLVRLVQLVTFAVAFQN
jgi:transcriptional regulator with GAF, ATPase, and Fis domain